MATPDPTDAQTIAALQARVAELEAANATLQAESTGPGPSPGPTVAAEEPQPKHRLRAVAVVAFLVIGALLLPVAAVTSWARVVLTDTDGFVATYAPLARDPQVQAYITSEVVATIDERINIDQQVDDLVAGLTGVMEDRPAAVAALNALRQPAADGVRTAITRATSQVVASEAFASTWEEALRLSHQGAVNALQGDPNAALVITQEGLGVRLAPIIERVKQVLIERGFNLAASIPTVDRTIVLVQSSEFAKVQTLYRLVVALGTWLPFVAFAFLAAAVLLARRRVTVLIIAATLLGLAAVLILGSLVVGRLVVLASVPATVVPSGVLQLFYDTATDRLGEVAIAALALAVVIVVLAWFAGPYATPRKLQGAYAGMTDSLRRNAESHGLSTGRFGEWLARSQTWLRVAVGAIAVLVLVFNRPLTPGMIIGTAIIALIVILVLNLLSRPVTDRERMADPVPESG